MLPGLQVERVEVVLEDQTFAVLVDNVGRRGWLRSGWKKDLRGGGASWRRRGGRLTATRLTGRCLGS